MCRDRPEAGRLPGHGPRQVSVKFVLDAAFSPARSRAPGRWTRTAWSGRPSDRGRWPRSRRPTSTPTPGRRRDHRPTDARATAVPTPKPTATPPRRLADAGPDGRCRRRRRQRSRPRRDADVATADGHAPPRPRPDGQPDPDARRPRLRRRPRPRPRRRCTPTRRRSTRPTSRPGPGILIAPADLAGCPMRGAAWTGLKARADGALGTPNISNQDDGTDQTVLAKALVYARTGFLYLSNAAAAASGARSAPRPADGPWRSVGTCPRTSSPPTSSRSRPSTRRSTRTCSGPGCAPCSPRSSTGMTLVTTHEQRPNNWGTHAGAARAADRGLPGRQRRDGAHCAGVPGLARRSDGVRRLRLRFGPDLAVRRGASRSR